MNRWTIRFILRHISLMNRKSSYLVTLLVIVFIFMAYLQQNRIQEYSRYNWLQSGNRELLSLQSSATNTKLKTNSTFSLKINKSDKSVANNGRVLMTELKTCKPKYNVVFLKTHKCASTTVQNIFMRNGFINNKVFVLPAKDNYLGHPMPFSRSLVPDPKLFNNSYNILTHHSRLNYESMRSLMPNNTLFITIVREPVHLFESMFHYYRLDKFWNISIDLFNDDNYVVADKVRTNRYIGKIGINQMMFDLGLNFSDFTRPFTVKKYIEKLDNIFDLVMVSERMDESLVLLKSLLCWSTDDIIAFKLNARQTTAKSNLTEMATFRIKTLNWADSQLYKHFSKKFSLMVKAFGAKKMKREVSELRNRTNEWTDYCVGTERHTKSANKTKNSIIIKLENKHLDNTTCCLLTAQELDFTKFLRIRQMKAFPGSVFKPPKSDIKTKLKKYEEKRQLLLKSKLLSISPKYRQMISSKLPQMITTIDPLIHLEKAFKDFTFKKNS